MSTHQKIISAIYDVVPGFAVEQIGGRDMLRCGDSQGSIAIDVGQLAAHIQQQLGLT